MNSTAEFEAWSLRCDYLQETANIYAQVGQHDDAGIYLKALPTAIEQRERYRKDVLSGK